MEGYLPMERNALEGLNDAKLLNSYYSAIHVELSDGFISYLYNEIKRRNLEIPSKKSINLSINEKQKSVPSPK
jgi:hypothetical protein